MKKYVISLAFLVISSAAFTQSYDKQVGIRLGVTSGLSGKVIKDDRTAIEGALGFRDGGIQLIGLLEAYHPLIKTNTVHWMLYYGGGGHVGYIDGYNKVRRWSNTAGYYWEEQRIAGPVIGIDAVFGTDYTFHKVPITLSIEFKPFVELQAFQHFKVNFWDFGFGIAYRFRNN
jgi:hypothetical protein